MSTIKYKKSEDEEQIKAKSHEISHMRQEKLELHDKIAELEKRLAERESEFSVLQGKLNKIEEEGSAQKNCLHGANKQSST
ncbi:hypothetical protein EI017_25345 [Escherichia coli]|nr:hypothetical protein [Escherichia coli]